MRSGFIGAFVLMFIAFFPFICSASGDPCKEYAVRKEYDKAIEECTKQIKGEIAVKYLEYSYSNRGAAYANKKQYDEAISDYSKATELNPEYATAFYNRAIAYANKQSYDNAILDFSKVIGLNPDDSAAYVGRATAYANKKRYDRAISDYTKAIELNPENYGAYYNRSMVYEVMKQYDRAVSDCNKAIELSALTPAAAEPAASSSSSPACLTSVPTASEEGKTIYHVQLGVFKNKDNASALAGKFRRKGYDAFVMKGLLRDRGKIYRVLIGKFEDRRESAKLAAEIREKEKMVPSVFSE